MGKAERTKQYITRVAAILFNKKGYLGASVNDIVDATQATRGTLYGHFDGKKALYLASAEILLERWITGLLSAISPCRTAAHQLDMFFRWYEKEAIASADGGSPVINLAVESDDLNAVVKTKTSMAVNRLISILSEVIAEGITRGELAVGTDAASFAIRAVTAAEGAAALTRITGNLKIMRTVFLALKSELQESMVSQTGASGETEEIQIKTNEI